MGKIIESVNLEGLSSEGILALREFSYEENKKSLPITLILLLVCSLIPVHKFYLGFNTYAWAITALNLVVIIVAVSSSMISIWYTWAWLLFVFELINSSFSVKLSNKRLSQQLDQEISK